MEGRTVSGWATVHWKGFGNYLSPAEVKSWFAQPKKYYFPGLSLDKITIFHDKVYKI